jgi:hypothetical protein
MFFASHLSVGLLPWNLVRRGAGVWLAVESCSDVIQSTLMDADRIIHAIIGWAKAHPAVQRDALVGSYARGMARAGQPVRGGPVFAHPTTPSEKVRQVTDRRTEPNPDRPVSCPSRTELAIHGSRQTSRNVDRRKA